eukprot:s2370_g11.t2
MTFGADREFRDWIPVLVHAIVGAKCNEEMTFGNLAAYSQRFEDTSVEAGFFMECSRSFNTMVVPASTCVARGDLRSTAGQQALTAMGVDVSSVEALPETTSTTIGQDLSISNNVRPGSLPAALTLALAVQDEGCRMNRCIDRGGRLIKASNCGLDLRFLSADTGCFQLASLRHVPGYFWNHPRLGWHPPWK